MDRVAPGDHLFVVLFEPFLVHFRVVSPGAAGRMGVVFAMLLGVLWRAGGREARCQWHGERRADEIADDRRAQGRAETGGDVGGRGAAAAAETVFTMPKPFSTAYKSLVNGANPPLEDPVPFWAAATA